MMRRLDFYNATAAAQLLEVRPSRFYVLMARDDAPEPYEAHGGARLWDGPELRAFKADRQDARLQKPHARATVLRSYRACGVVAQAARAAAVDPATARRWLRELNVPLPRDERTA